MKGLLFTPEMARAVMREQNPKTETRRVVPGRLKLYEEGWSLDGRAPRTCDIDWCQYEAGTVVCLLTTWAVAKQFDNRKPSRLSPRTTALRFWHAGMGTPKPEWAGRLRPGRFLPNKLRHLMPALRIGDVDVQRVRQISAAAAIAEGIDTGCVSNGVKVFRDYSQPYIWVADPRVSFRSLWNSINAKRGYSWARNPQVFVIKFGRVPHA
jgi:hypothetical protein